MCCVVRRRSELSRGIYVAVSMRLQLCHPVTKFGFESVNKTLWFNPFDA